MYRSFVSWALALVVTCFTISATAEQQGIRFPRKALFERQTTQTCDSDEILGVFQSFTKYAAQYTSECSVYLGIPDTTITVGTDTAKTVYVFSKILLVQSTHLFPGHNMIQLAQ